MTEGERDVLAESLNDLSTNVSTVIKSGTNNMLKLLEKMNIRVAEQYATFGDIASGLRVFVEQLGLKSRGFAEYVQQIDATEEQTTDLEAVISIVGQICFPVGTQSAPSFTSMNENLQMYMHQLHPASGFCAGSRVKCLKIQPSKARFYFNYSDFPLQLQIQNLNFSAE